MSDNNGKTLTSTGAVRNALAECLVRVQQGSLSHGDAKSIIGLANQITTSLAVEIKYANLQSLLGHTVDELGALNISAASK